MDSLTRKSSSDAYSIYGAYNKEDNTASSIISVPSEASKQVLSQYTNLPDSSQPENLADYKKMVSLTRRIVASGKRAIFKADLEKKAINLVETTIMALREELYHRAVYLISCLVLLGEAQALSNAIDKEGINFNIKEGCGATLLHRAEQHNCSEAIRFLKSSSSTSHLH